MYNEQGSKEQVFFAALCILHKTALYNGYVHTCTSVFVGLNIKVPNWHLHVHITKGNLRRKTESPNNGRAPVACTYNKHTANLERQHICQKN